MRKPNTSARAPASLSCLAGVIVVFGLAALVCALLPSGWLHRFGERLGHADDVTRERIGRLRWIGVGLAMAQGLLAGFLLTWGRTGAKRFLDDLWTELASATPFAAIRGIKEWVTQSGLLHVIVLLVVLATAIGIRLRYLDVPMDYDEAYSFLNYASRPLYQGLADYNSTNNHLLNTLFMHAAYRCFGPQEWALRMHVFVAGIGLVGSAYALGRRLQGGEVGLVAAAVVATSYVMLNYSVNARGYIWVAWMTALLLQIFWRIATAEPQPHALDWLAGGIVAVLGIFAMPTMAYSILGCVGWLTIRILRHGRPAYSKLAGLEIWTLLVGLAALWLYAPALIFRGVSAWQHPFVSPQPLSDWIRRVPAAWVYALKSGTESLVPWLVPTALCLIGLVVMWLLKRQVFWLIVAVPLATFLVTSLQRVAPPPRVFSFLSPLFALMAASGLVATLQLICLPHRPEAAEKSRRQVSVFCSLVAAGLCAWSYSDGRRNPLPGNMSPAFLVEDVSELWSDTKNANQSSSSQLWRFSVIETVVTLEPILQPGDRVLVSLPADLPFHFYATRRRWTTPIGGQPQVGERLFLVIRCDEDPRVALRENLSLRFTDSWIFQMKWQLLASGDLAIWQAPPIAADAMESDSR